MNNIDSFLDLEEERIFWSEKYGKIYHNIEASTPYQHLIDDIINYTKDLKPKTVLDLGCGQGILIKRLLNIHPNIMEVYGVDYSKPLLLKAQNYFKNEKRVKFIEHDLNTPLNLSPEIFDLIIAGLSICYVPQYAGSSDPKISLEKILAQCYHLLNHYGVLAWSTPTKAVNFMRVFIKSIPDMIDVRHPSRIINGPKILKHAFTIQAKGRSNQYYFLNYNEIESIHKMVGFKSGSHKLSFADQAYVIRANKNA